MYLGRENIYGLFEKQLLEVDQPGVPQNNYRLLWQVGSTTSVLVVSDGLFLEPGLDYVVGLDGYEIAFNTPPDPLKRTYVLFLARELATPRHVGIEPILKRFVGQAGVSDFDLTKIPVNGDALIVFINGVQKRYADDFTLSGSIITFTSEPAVGADISVYIHGVERFDVFGDLPNEQFIDTIHIYNNAITNEKIMNGAVTYEKVSFPLVDCKSFYDPLDPSYDPLNPHIETFGGMTIKANYPLINVAQYRFKWPNTVELLLDFTCQFESVESNVLRYKIPCHFLADELAPLGIVQLQTGSLLESGQQIWGGKEWIDVYRQNGINYTLTTDWRFRIKCNYEYTIT